MTPHSRPSIRPLRGLAITRERPVLVEIDDDLLGGAPRNRMNITVWVGDADPEELQPTIARALAIGFLERALEKMRATPATLFDATNLQRALRGR